MLVVLAQKQNSGGNWAAAEIMLMYLGLQDTVQEEVIVTCIIQHPDYNPGMAETQGGSDTTRVGKKGLILQDRKADAESGLSNSDLS